MKRNYFFVWIFKNYSYTEIYVHIVFNFDCILTEIKGAINEYRENNLRWISSICKNNTIEAETDASNSIKIDTALKEIKLKHLSEFGDQVDHHESLDNVVSSIFSNVGISCNKCMVNILYFDILHRHIKFVF